MAFMDDAMRWKFDVLYGQAIVPPRPGRYLRVHDEVWDSGPQKPKRGTGAERYWTRRHRRSLRMKARKR